MEAGSPPPLSLAAGVAIAEAVSEYLPEPAELKWPNDLLFAGRKLAGILVEVSAGKNGIEHIVLGIGLNVNQDHFPPPLDATAGSLRQACGRPLDRAHVLADAINQLEKWIEQLEQDGAAPIVAEWLNYAAWLGEKIRVSTGGRTMSGVALGLTPEGALRLRDDQGTEQTILSGDTFRLG